jgi:hypothetical protein
LEGNSNASYAQLRSGSAAGPDFSFFKQQAGFKAPEAHSMAGLQKENLQSGAFAFKSGDVTPGKVASYSKYQRGTFYGADDGAQAMGPTPAGS